MRLVLLCICAFALLRGVDLNDASLLETTRLDSAFNVRILKEGEKIYAVVANRESGKVYSLEDFLKRATPKQKAFIQARMQEARALAATPPKIKHLFSQRVNEEEEKVSYLFPALLSLKPIPGTSFQIATIKDYNQAHKDEFYGDQAPTYSAWLLDQNLSFAIRLEHALGPKQALKEMTKSVQWAKEANERYYTHDFNTLFDRIPKSSIITLRSENPHAKQLYILLSYIEYPSDRDTPAYKRTLEIVNDLPQMLKSATLHLVPTQSKWTYDSKAIKALIQDAHCLPDNRTKIARIQRFYRDLANDGTLVETSGCPVLKDYGKQQEWVWIFFGQGACGDGVKDWHPMPIVYEYKED
ncbi:hypothetical protein [Helicobacter felis]|uniref:Sensor protein n=1 Tax=Helicobacter felis (strain ATCC 49179 / CCUG 28539 / NCTC 12436 / CS1) TaxID=936155 RepID=E7A8P1_HELFC|nr:hypothetical protein [Helicobacter felis]CBY82378.1 sensor protein [Helicobacter felis ATCC 49179]